jgi:hypothetical protein
MKSCRCRGEALRAFWTAAVGGSGYQYRPELVCALQTIECKTHELRHKSHFKRLWEFQHYSFEFVNAVVVLSQSHR